VVSSGDFAALRHGWVGTGRTRDVGWDGKTPRVQLFPGITTLQAAAARVGTPLMRLLRYCTLLTRVIEKRLAAAAKADLSLLFIIRAIIQQMALARTIFLKYVT